MRAAFIASLVAGSLLVVSGGLARTSIQNSVRAAPQPLSPPAQQQTPSDTAPSLQVITRMVSLDVTATDSHGNPVRDLKKQELQIFEERNNGQTVSRFEFVDGSAAVPASPTATPNGASTYSNRLPLERLKVAPTVLLMDGLNTDTPNQMYARRQMLTLLKTLPRDVPVSVFLLGNSLQLLQGFTTDPALLQAALNKALTPQMVDQNPADDADSLSNRMLDSISDDSDGGVAEDMAEEIQDFEKEEYASRMDVRVNTTLAALTSLAQYLGGIPGRKNLIWVSQAFPLSLIAEPDLGKNEFKGTREYGGQLDSAAQVLTDEQVAVYPVDAAGLQTNESLSASQQVTPRIGSKTPDGGFAARINREENNRDQSQASMNTFAKDTGGKTCANTNDLSKCVDVAQKESSSYYELGFYPRNINWDGKFHKLVVKTTRPGVKLAYRAGYFATDVAAQAKRQNPDDQLRDACSRLMPPTGIGLTARLATADEARGVPGGLGYQVYIAPGDVTFTSVGEASRLNLEVAFCTYGAKTNSATLTKQGVAVAVGAEVMQRWQSTGIPDVVAMRPDPGIQRVRVVVVDLPTATMGAIDIPVHPEDLAHAAAAAPALPPPEKVSVPPQVAIADRTGPPLTASQLNFNGAAGTRGTLDWTGNALVYGGTLGIDQSAPAFFKYAFGAYRCEAGNLVPLVAGGADAKLEVTFRAADGRQITVDLKGVEPDYSGNMFLDPTARSFFDAVWKLGHCQAGN